FVLRQEQSDCPLDCDARIFDRRRRSLMPLLPPACRFPGCGYRFRLIPRRLCGPAAAEDPTKGAGCMNDASAPPPTASSLFELSGAGILGMAPFAILPVPSIKRERHGCEPSLAPDCTPLHVGNVFR